MNNKILYKSVITHIDIIISVPTLSIYPAFAPTYDHTANPAHALSSAPEPAPAASPAHADPLAPPPPLPPKLYFIIVLSRLMLCITNRCLGFQRKTSKYSCRSCTHILPAPWENIMHCLETLAVSLST